MRMLNWLASLVLAGALTCLPALAADVKISQMPAATLPDNAIKLSAVQGSGCATGVSPCSNVTVTTGSLASYLAAQSSFTAVYQPLDSDLTSIAALSTTSYGRSLLTKSDAGAVRQDLGASYVPCKSAVASSLTGSTSEGVLATCTIPAGAMGPNGQVEVVAIWSTTSNANSKSLRVRFGGAAQLNLGVTATVSAQTYTRISNRNATNAQVASANNLAGPGTSNNAVVTSSIDTTAPVSLTILGLLGVSTDTITLESYLVRVTYGS